MGRQLSARLVVPDQPASDHVDGRRAHLTVPATTVPTSTAGSSTAPVADRLVEALLYGARTIVGLNPTPSPQLNRVGEVLLIGVRILGPLLLGLALLAVLSRVKR